MFPILHIGPISFQTPGLILIIGLWIAISLSEKLHQKQGFAFEPIQQIIFFSLIFGLVFARLFYVFSYPKYFIQSPISIISLKPDLLDPWGAMIGIALVILWHIRRFKLNLASTLDSLSITLSIFLIFLSLADWAAGGQIGVPTHLPLGVYFQGAYRHPIQLYQILATILISILLLKVFLKKGKGKPARVATLFIFLVSTAQFVISGFILNQNTFIAGIRISQLFYFIIGLFSLYYLLDFPIPKRVTDG
ncbi:MAG: prolipoprotein diacylglyceryl transferase [Anaerolineales bacterium]